MTYLTQHDRDHLRAFRDRVAQTTMPHNISDIFREHGIVWQASALATPVASGLAKVCLCKMLELETDEQPGDLWMAAVVTHAPSPAPGFADEVPGIFQLTCPDEFNYGLWLTYFKPLPADQQAWVFCVAGPQISGMIDQPEGFETGMAIEYIDRLHPPLVRSELLECRVGPGVRVPEDEEILFVNERYNVASEQLYYEMLESAGAVHTVEDMVDDRLERLGWPAESPSQTRKQSLQPHLFRWFDSWRRRSSLN